MPLNEEAARLILSWLTVKECTYLRMTAHCMDFLSDDDIYAIMAQFVVAPVQLAGITSISDESVTRSWTETARSVLDIPSYKGLLQCFCRFNVPLVGYWRKVRIMRPVSDQSDEPGHRFHKTFEQIIVESCCGFDLPTTVR